MRRVVAAATPSRAMTARAALISWARRPLSALRRGERVWNMPPPYNCLGHLTNAVGSGKLLTVGQLACSDAQVSWPNHVFTWPAPSRPGCPMDGPARLPMDGTERSLTPQTPGRVMPSYPPGRSTRPGPDAGPGDAVLPRDVPPGPALPTQRTGELTPLI